MQSPAVVGTGQECMLRLTHVLCPDGESSCTHARDCEDPGHKFERYESMRTREAGQISKAKSAVVSSGDKLRMQREYDAEREAPDQCESRKLFWSNRTNSHQKMVIA